METQRLSRTALKRHRRDNTAAHADTMRAAEKTGEEGGEEGGVGHALNFIPPTPQDAGELANCIKPFSNPIN
jgi:hypothetical protein